MKRTLYILCLLFLCLAGTHTASGQCNRVADSLELVNFYNHFNGPNWTVQWNFNNPIDTWTGIAVDNGCLTRIRLNKRNLTGTMYNINLPGLIELTLEENQISGPLPNFSNMDTLEILNLRGNALTGSIPNFSNMPTLIALNLAGNNLTGTAPNFFFCPELRVLELWSNQLVSPLPNLNHLQSLIDLGLGNNNFEEPFPSLNLPQLISLDLTQNRFFGPLPNISGLPWLGDFSIASNNFTGPIPNFSFLPRLRSFTAFGNQFTGPIPSFSNTPLLGSLWLSSNNFSGGFPNFSNAAQLAEFRCNYCGLQGQIPNLSNLPNLYVLNLEGNNFSGTIPSFQDNPNIRELNIAHNNLDSISTFANLSNVQELLLSANQIRHVPDLSSLVKVRRLHLQQNLIEGALSDISGLQFLEEFNIAENRITAIPDVGNLPKLRSFAAANNLIEGALPNFNNCPELLGFNLSNNLISGVMPQYNHLPKLRGLYLQHNMISGKLPDFFSNPSLQAVWVANNEIDSVETFYPNISNLTINNNKLTFDDIIGNFSFTHLFTSMKPVEANPAFSLQGDSLLVDLKFDAGITTSTYRWFKNGAPNPIAITQVNRLLLAQYAETDTLTVQVTNSQVPSLTLHVLPFNLRDVRPVIRGVLFKDDNANCSLDAQELRLNHWQIELAGNNRSYFTQSFQDGSFRIVADTGTYTVSVRLPNNAWQVCPGNYTLTAGFSDTLEVFIPVEAYEECPELQVNLSIGNANLRRCFENRYIVNYCNRGTVPAADVEVLLQVDPWIVVDSFSVPFEALGGGAYRITAGGLEAGDCGTFLMYVTPDCDSPLGVAQCVNSRVEPVDICSTFSSQWSGATITASGSCTGDEVVFTLRNIGGQATTDSLEYRIFQNGIMVETVRFSIAAGDSLIIIKPSDNDSWRLETDQADGHPCSVLPSVSIDACGQSGSGQVSVSFALQFPNDPGCPFEDNECHLIVGSYDPNDKMAFPAGHGPDHFIEPGTDIEYLVRFQNVGNDTAFHVFVRDTLSPFLDPATVKVTGYSHPYQLRITENGALEFAFYHIHLTDTIRNEPGSHGYIKFRVAQTAGNAIGTVIHNQAAIYFDFNAPIFTNVVFHTLGVNFVPDAIAPKWEVPPSDLYLDCPQNPDLNAIIQQWLDAAGGAQVFDHSGEVTISHDFSTLNSDCNGLGGIVEVGFTATDKWGNQSTRTALLAVADTMPPAWEVLPESFEAACSDDPGVQLENWLMNFGGGSVWDACGAVSVTTSYELTGACIDSVQVTFIATDVCGNASSATAQFIIHNTQAPTIISPAQDLTLSCEDTDIEGQIQQWLLANGETEAAGACSGLAWSHDFGGLTPECGLAASATVAFTAEDECGNMATQTANIHVIDTVAPAWVQTPEPFVFQCGAENAWENLDAWLAQAEGAQAEDNCDATFVEAVFTASIPCTGADTLMAIFIARDACGNASAVEVPVYVLLPSAARGIAATHSEIRVFPNPVRTTVWIQWESERQSVFRLRVFSASGSMIEELQGRGNTVELPVGRYNSGVYIFTLDTEVGRYGWGRFVKE